MLEHLTHINKILVLVQNALCCFWNPHAHCVPMEEAYRMVGTRATKKTNLIHALECCLKSWLLLSSAEETHCFLSWLIQSSFHFHCSSVLFTLFL
jgi:hypothetical protein